MQDPYRPPGAPIGYATHQPPTIPVQSGLGIASFIIAGFSILASVAVIVSMVTKLRTVTPEHSPGAVYGSVMMMGLAFVGIMFLALVGLILGIVALTQPHQKRLMSILGTVLNALIIVGYIVLMVIGRMR